MAERERETEGREWEKFEEIQYQCRKQIKYDKGYRYWYQNDPS